MVFYEMWQFWLVVLGLMVFVPGIIRVVTSLPILRRVPWTTWMMVCIGALIITSGVFGGIKWPTGSLTKTSGFMITDLQETTSFATDISGSVAANANQDDLWDVRLTDAQANETSGYYELDDGVLTVTRTGDLTAMSCPVVATTSTFGSEKTPGDGNQYKIVEETTLGELEVYLRTCSSASCASATTYPKGATSLAFDEGVSLGYVGVLIEVEESAHDQLNQYSYKDVVVDVCGKPATFRIHRMD